MIKLLTVTNERRLIPERGLHRYLSPVLNKLQTHNGYLTRGDLGERSVLWQKRLQRLISRLFKPVSAATDVYHLTGLVLSGLNMGRLAARVAVRDQHSHVHCHDLFIGIGFYLFKRFFYRSGVRWGVTVYSSGSCVQALSDNGVALGCRARRWLKGWERRVLLAADWVTCTADSSLQQLQRDLDLPAPGKNWCVVPAAYPVAPSPARSQARQALDLPDGRRLILVHMSGEHTALPDPVIQALVEYSEQCVVLLSNDDPALAEAFEAAAGLPPVTTAAVDDPGLLLRAADLCITDSAAPGSDLLVAEACSVATPVLLLKHSGMQGEAGQIKEAESAALLASARELIGAMPAGDSVTGIAKQARETAWLAVDQAASVYELIYTGAFCPAQSFVADRPDHMADFAGWERLSQAGSICPVPAEMPLDSRRVLVFAPHQDDETIGCGGTIALLREKGAEVRVIVMTDGALGCPPGFDPRDIVAARRAETLAATGVLGIDNVVFWDEPDASMSVTGALLDKIRAELLEFQPDAVFLPSPLDSHKDHVAGALAVLRAWDQADHVGDLWLYEVWTPLPATHVVDISATIEAKLAALRCYEIPLSFKDYTAHVKGLNHYRGIAFTAQDRVAEGFVQLRAENWHTHVEEMTGLRDMLASAGRS